MTAKRTRRRRSHTRADARPPRRIATPGAVLVLILAGAWAYAPSFTGVLVLDDVRAIARNQTIRTLWPPSVPLAPPAGSTVAGRPVANLSFAINYALAPDDVRDEFAPARRGAPEPANPAFLRNLWGYHLANLLIHLGAAMAVFGVARRTLTSPRLAPQFGPPASTLAFAVAVVWVVHPLTTESVTYIVQRVESLMGLWYLLTIYCAIRAEDDPRRRRAWMTAAVACCTLGMATKETMVTAPLVVAAWYYVFTDGLRARWPRVAALAATWIVLALLVTGEQRAPSVDIAGRTIWRYLQTQTGVIVHYLRLAVVPAPLVFLYSWPLADSLASVAVPAAVVAAIVGATLAALVRRHPLGFAGAAFLLILAPTSSVLPVVTEVAAEHRMYLPLAAVIAVLAASLHRLGTWLHARGWLTSRFSAPAGMVLLAVVTAVYADVTRARNRVYTSELGLWADTVAKEPENQRARVAYGTALAAVRDLPAAEVELRAALALNAADPIAHARLGSVLAAQDRMDEAVTHLQAALELRPDDVDAHRALGQVYAARRQDAAAVVHLGRVAEVYSDDAALLGELAGILADSREVSVRDPARALALAQRAADLTARQDPAMLEVLSVAFAATGRFGDAAAVASEALPLARARGAAPLAQRLEYRAAAYGARAGS